MDNIFYALLNKFEAIVKSFADFSVNAKSDTEIDNTPNKLNLPGDIGDIITKDRQLIYYKSVNSNKFLSLSSQFPQLIVEYKSVLSSGINRVATWTKGVNGWKFNGYVTQNMDENCCLIDTYNVPYITWNPIRSQIIYGEPLTDDQLNAVATYNGQYLEGTYKYKPDFGEVLHGGTHTLNVIFYPEDNYTYTTASKSVNIEVLKVGYGTEYRLIWDDFSSSIIYGNPLTEEYLNARAEYNSGSISGKYVYNPGYGAILSVGTNIPLHCTFYPDASRDFEVLSASQDVDVIKANITDFASWKNPIHGPCGGKYTEDILSVNVGAVETNYNVYYNDEGDNYIYIGKNFSSSYTKGTTHRLTASIVPTNTDNYESGELYTNLIIDPLNVNIDWNIKNFTIEYGSVFSTDKYFNNVTVTDDDGNVVTGSLSYSYSIDGTTYTSITPDITTCTATSGTIFLKCTFNLTDTSTCYKNTVSTVKTLQVVKNTSYNINWSAESTITYGTTLSSVLNATTTPSISGTFVYTNQHQPVDSSTIMPHGQHQLIATFNPTDSDNYVVKTATKLLIVNQNTNYTINWGVPVSIDYGTNLVNILTASATQTGTPAYYNGTITEDNRVYPTTILPIGTHILSVVWTPTDTNYGQKTESRTFSVIKSTNYSIEWDLYSVNPNVVHSLVSFDKRSVNINEWSNLLHVNQGGKVDLLKGTKNFYKNSISPSNKLNSGDLLPVGTNTIVCEFIPNDPNFDTISIIRTIIVSDYTFITTYISPHLFNIVITGYRNDIDSNTSITLNDVYTVLCDGTNTDTYNVIAIENNAFNDLNNNSLKYVTSMTINESSNTLTSIGNTAFSGFINLTSIINGTDIDEDVFENVTQMGSNPFMGCSKLSPAKINNNYFTTINEVLYQYDVNQTYKVKCYYESLTNNSFVLPKEVSSIGTYAFSNNVDFKKNKLQVLIINNDENDIIFDQYCFYKCFNIKTIYFPGDKNIIVNNPINESQYSQITDYNLYYNNNNTVFYYNNPNILSQASAYINSINSKQVGTTSRSDIPSPATKVGNDYVINTVINFTNYNDNNVSNNVLTVTTIHVPYGYDTITGSALGNCINLTTINIPASITGIDEKYGLCYAAPKLNSINIYPYQDTALMSCDYKVFNNQTSRFNYSEGTPKLSNILFKFYDVPGEVDTYTLVTYPMGLTYRNYILYSPNSSFYIDKIGNYAFYGNKNLNNLIWNYESNTVLKYIGDQSFFQTKCIFDGDVNQYIPSYVEYIGKRAFYNNKAGIRRAVINDNLRNYGGEVCNAFTMFNKFDNTANPYAAIGEVVEISASTIPMPISIEMNNETVSGYTGIKTDFADQAVYLFESSTAGDDFYNTASNAKNLLTLYMTDEEDRLTYTLPESIEIVSDFASYGNHGLKSFEVESTSELNYIGNYGIANCRNLETVKIPPLLKRINDNAFSNNPLLANINFGNCDIQVIGQTSFAKDYSLKSIELKFDTESVSISHKIFNNCHDLRTIVLSGAYPLNDDGNNISTDAFADINVSLDNFYIYYPEDWSNETSHPNWSTLLSILQADSKVVLIPYKIDSDNVNYIDYDTYIEVCGVANDPSTINISSTINSKPVTTISDYAFVNKSMTTLSLPSSLTSIGKYIVSGCTNLETITIASGGAFSVSNNALYKTDNTEKILYAYAPNSSATYYTSSNMTQIRESAFDSCQNLDSIYIDSTVKTIEEHAFCQCKELSKIYVDSGNNDFIATNGTIEGNNNSSDDGILFRINKDVNNTPINLTLLYVPQNINTHFLRIPSGFSINSNILTVTSIASYAVENTSINILILPSGMSSYSNNAIIYNNSLNSLILTCNSESLPLDDSFLRRIVKEDSRNTIIYTTSIPSGLSYNPIQCTLITYNNANYYIYNNTILLACTVDNTNSDSNINVYNNFYNADAGNVTSYNEIDNFALANRAGTMNNYSLTFLNDPTLPENVTINKINTLNSNIFYGSSMINQLIFVNMTAPSSGSERMFNLSEGSVIPEIRVTSGYLNNWQSFIENYKLSSQINVTSI